MSGRKDEIRTAWVQLGQHLHAIDSLHAIVHLTLEIIMAEKQEVLDRIKELKDLIDQDTRRDQEAVDQLMALNASLRAKVQELEANGTVSAGDFDEILTLLEGVKNSVTPVSPLAVAEPLDAATAKRDAASVEINADDETVADTGVVTDADAMNGGNAQA